MAGSALKMCDQTVFLVSFCLIPNLHFDNIGSQLDIEERPIAAATLI